ncbi:TPT domain-containing protein [Aphelenchoides bicaudatus]|nr:TPT domain-containing protein [Aphelenchoides bicaudatus]
MSKNEWWFGFQIIAICVFWYGSSSAQNIVNKLALQSFPYPLTISLSSLLNNVLYAIPLTRILHIKQTHVSSTYLIKTILPISLGRAAAVTTAYFGLQKLAVSFAQTVKGTSPIFTIIISRFVLGERQSGRVYFSLVPIICGVAIASITEIRFDSLGVMAALFSTCIFSWLNILAKKVFDETNMHPITFLSINSQLSAVILFPLWSLKDGRDMWLKYTTHDNSNQMATNEPVISTFMMFLVLSGLLSFIQNFCAFLLIHQLTTLSYAVSNAAKRVSVILLSLLTLQNPVTPLNLIGMLISVLGIFVYNRAKHSENKKRSTSPVVFDEQPNQMLRRRERTISLREMHSSKSDVRLLLTSN